MSSSPILLIDGRNVMYRAIFANKKDTHKSHRSHHFTIMMRFMWGWLDKFKPVSVNIFWDARKSTLWRRKISTEYKVKPESDYLIDIKDDLIFTEAAARAIFQQAGVRQFSKARMEADDLIYSACRILAPRPVVIISSDGDYTQVVFRMPHVRLWNPMADSGRGKFVAAPDHDPAVAKALDGDKTDNVTGYRGIGPVKSAKLARCIEDKQTFLDERGHQPFIMNLLLVDLSLNPELLKNDLYVQKVLAQEVNFDKQAITNLAKKHKVSGLISEYSRIVLPFKLMLERAEAAV